MNLSFRNFSILILTLAVSLLSATAKSATFDLDLLADGDSRWFELFSGAFNQIDAEFNGSPLLDGAFSVADETNQLLSGTTQINLGNEAAFDAFNPTNFITLGSGLDHFPDEGDFGVVGSVTYDDITGVVTDLVLDFDDHVAFTNTIISGSVGDGYETVLSNVDGTVSSAGTQVTSVDLTADVQFSYGGGALAYNGVVRFDGDSFDLFVDDAPQTGFGPIRFSWDIEGQVLNVVPEPSVGCLLMLGMTAFTAVRNRKTAR